MKVSFPVLSELSVVKLFFPSLYTYPKIFSFSAFSVYWGSLFPHYSAVLDIFLNCLLGTGVLSVVKSLFLSLNPYVSS